MLNNAQTLNLGRFVELISLYFSTAPGKPVGWTTDLHFSNSALSYNVGPTWNGITFKPANFKISGINIQSGGQIPEPSFQIMLASQVTGNFLDFMRSSGADIRGVRIVRRIMSVECLDTGSTPSTDTNDRVEQSFYIIQKSEEIGHQFTFKLSTAMGLDSLNDKVNRTLSTNQCNKKYRVFNIVDNTFKYTSVEDGGCEWGQAGEQTNFPYTTTWGTPYYDANNQLVTDPKLDRCSLSVAGCKCRFNWSRPEDAVPISINLLGNTGV